MTFRYTYSASASENKKEVEEIRKKYLMQDEAKEKKNFLTFWKQNVIKTQTSKDYNKPIK